MAVSGEPVRLSTVNGIGFDLKGFTRADEYGMYFATRWFSFVGLPIVPLDRYYLARVGADVNDLMQTVTRYRIAGQSRLRAGEILRTYLFCWIFAPAFVAGPAIALVSNAAAAEGALGIGWVVGILVGWLVCSFVAIFVLLDRYRTRWAPVRTARRLPRRPSFY